MTLDEIISLAKRTYASDDVDFDDAPATSVAYDGTWVQAWVWVPHVPEEGNENQNK